MIMKLHSFNIKLCQAVHLFFYYITRIFIADWFVLRKLKPNPVALIYLIKQQPAWSPDLPTHCVCVSSATLYFTH